MKIAVLLLLIYGASSQAVPCEVSAKVEAGLVCGKTIKDATGGDIASFLSIPYAKPPLGRLRFAEPQKPDPFVGGVYQATAPGPVCPQLAGQVNIIMRLVEIDEDCLSLNVHVPLRSLPEPGGEKPLLPVLVYIHGGSWADGSGGPDTYGPEFICPKDVILVTFNHRLNVFGFLSLGSKYIPGNAGLRDAVQVLKWVKSNIKGFGGDPDQVTLGGISAGSSLAHLISISPAVRGKGLFKRVLLMSGTAVGAFFSTSPMYAKVLSTMFLQSMGISVFSTPKAIHRALTKAPLEKIYKALAHIQKMIGNRANFVPVRELPAPGFTTIIPKDPWKLLEEGYGKEFTMLLGFTNSECSMFQKDVSEKLLPKMKMNPLLSVPFNLLLSSNLLTVPTILKEMSREYYNGSSISLSGYLPFCSDAFYVYPSLKTVEKRLAGGEPTYMYQFGYEYTQLENKLKVKLQSNWTGVGHTEDFSYVFRVNEALGPVHQDEMSLPYSDFQMRDWMTDIVANFVKTGSPSTDPSKWPPAGKQFGFLSITEPKQYDFMPATTKMLRMKTFFDELYRIGRRQK